MKTENGKETAYVYNSLNQLVSDSDNSYEYDLNGNLVRVIGASHSALYEFNAENRLVKATVQQGNNVIEESYTYDYAGNRTSKTTRTNGHVEFVKYLNDTNSELTNVLCELDENGTEKCVYTIGADLISQERDGKVSVYLYDGHGSVVGLATMGGKVTDTYTYDAFGNLIDSTGSTKNCYRYCGEQFDETTGLYYLRARYMDTSTGRFISQDSYNGSTYDSISLHKYLYANANPITYFDPSGYSSKFYNYDNLARDLSSEMSEAEIRRLNIEITTTRTRAESRDPYQFAKYVAEIIAIGVAVIISLAEIVVNAISTFDVSYCWIEKIANGEMSLDDVPDFIRKIIIGESADPQNDPINIPDPAPNESNKKSKKIYVAIRSFSGKAIVLLHEITELAAIGIMKSQWGEGIYSESASVVLEITRSASKIKYGETEGTVIAHNRNLKKHEMPHYHIAKITGGKVIEEGSAHAWYGKIRSLK